METIINPKYESVKDEVEDIVSHFDKGRLLYSGRNELRSFNIDLRSGADGLSKGNNGTLAVAAKRFKKLGIIRTIIYSWFRRNKALRSYSNAMELIHRGVGTPEPIAYAAEKRHGLIEQTYYLSAKADARDIKSELIDKEDYDGQLLEAYAAFVAELHERGILHRDLNPTNVLYEPDGDGGYRFMLIDINRMTLYDGAVPKAQCMENLTLFWWLSPVYRAVLDAYAKRRGWTQSDIDEAIRVKEAHDRRWIKKKNFTAIFKHNKLKRP